MKESKVIPRKKNLGENWNVLPSIHPKFEMVRNGRMSEIGGLWSAIAPGCCENYNMQLLR